MAYEMEINQDHARAAMLFGACFFLWTLPRWQKYLHETFTTQKLLDENLAPTNNGQYLFSAGSGLTFYLFAVMYPAGGIAASYYLAVLCSIVHFFVQRPQTIAYFEPNMFTELSLLADPADLTSAKIGLTSKGQITMGAIGALLFYLAGPLVPATKSSSSWRR